MPRLSTPCGSTSEVAGYMTAPSGLVVSPSDHRFWSRRWFRVVSRFTIPRMGSEYWINRVDPSRRPSLLPGGRASTLPKPTTSGAPIAGARRSSSGSPRTMPFVLRASKIWLIPPIAAALSVELERSSSVPPLRVHVSLDMILLRTSSQASDALAGKVVTHDHSNSHPSMGQVDSHSGGRHRGPIHRGAFGSRLRKHRHRRTNRLSSLRRTAVKVFRNVSMRRRAGGTLTPPRHPAMMTSSHRQSLRG